MTLSIRRIVDHVCSSIERANATYSMLYKTAMDHKLLKVDVRRALLHGPEQIADLPDAGS